MRKIYHYCISGASGAFDKKGEGSEDDSDTSEQEGSQVLGRNLDLIFQGRTSNFRVGCLLVNSFFFSDISRDN